MTTLTAPAALAWPHAEVGTLAAYVENMKRIGAALAELRENLDHPGISETELRAAIEAALAAFSDDDVFDVIAHGRFDTVLSPRQTGRADVARHLARAWLHQNDLQVVNAKSLRAILRDAGLAGVVGRVTSGRTTTRVVVPTAYLDRVTAALRAGLVEHGHITDADGEFGHRVAPLRMAGGESVVHIARQRRR